MAAEWDIWAIPLALLKKRLPELEAEDWEIRDVCPVPSVTGPIYAVVGRRELKPPKKKKEDA